MQWRWWQALLVPVNSFSCKLRKRNGMKTVGFPVQFGQLTPRTAVLERIGMGPERVVDLAGRGRLKVRVKCTPKHRPG